MNDQEKPKKRVLIAEDDPVSCHLLKSFLVKWGYDVAVVTDGTAALRVLESEDTPRLAVLDWMMPGMEGVQVCQRIRERKNRPYLYLLLLTARTDKQDLLQGLEFGADDYLTKPFDSKELRARLHVGERILSLQDDLIATREELRFRATHDVLTGISNRATVMDALRNELLRQAREHRPIGVILADIDHFKNINDTYGHLCGDEVLQAVARRMKECVRPYDSVGRYGGEEFLIIAPSADPPGTLTLAERIRAVIESQPVTTQAGEVRVTASLGAVVTTDVHSSDPQVLLHLADQALYRAKEKGRNRSELADAKESSSSAPSAAGDTPLKSSRR
ncbi:MAG TPA: diguanylate cyclase [Candidatus Acidoferrales bacterium]|nr:diguanylate cyclase [Candidatus Acidoferrales bacterium]